MQGFFHRVWSPRMPYSAAEKGGKKTQKVGKATGDPVRGRDAPITSPEPVLVGAANQYNCSYVV